MSGTEKVQTVVIGGGQAGLSTGYHLARRGLPFVILEANPRIGDPWRKRWDSLRLFTPARYDGIAGMPFPAPPHSFPTKDEMADYLERYAARFALPIRLGTGVDRLSREGDRYIVQAGARRFEAEHVVVAMATFQRPRVPPFAPELDPAIAQLHSSEYRNLSQLREGPVLVVGAGNSGSEIALESARGGRPTWLVGRDTGHIPFSIEGALGRLLVPFIFRVVFHRVLKVDTPIGRKARPKAVSQGAEGSRRCRGPARGPGERSAKRDAAHRRRAAPRGGERSLVHGVRSRILVDRPARLREGRGAIARARDRPG